MNEFKVGDIIRGKKNGYGYTNENMTKAEVLSVNNSEGTMEIKMLEVIAGGYLPKTIFPVFNNVSDFELITSPTPFKLGDMIQGKPYNGYAVTNGNMIKGVVTKLYPEVKMMTIKVLGHKDNGFNNNIFYVKNSLDSFEPYQKQKKESTSSNCTFDSDDKIFESLLHLNVNTDKKKNVSVNCKEYYGITTEANCDLSCDEFDYDYGLGLAIKRLGESMMEKAEKKNKVIKKTEKKYVKLCNLLSADYDAGLHTGDIVEVIKELDMSTFGNNNIFVKCKDSTYYGSVGAREKAEKYPFPVQTMSGSQYIPVKTWAKSDKPTNYVRVLKTLNVQRGVGINDGDIARVLKDEKDCLYIEAPIKNIFFTRGSFIDTDYFTFLGSSNKWEYVTPIF